MKVFLIVLLITLSGASPQRGLAQTTKATAVIPYYSVGRSTIEELMAHQTTKAILLKYAPKVFGNSMVLRAGKLTPKALQPYTAGGLSNEMLDKIEAELKQLAPPK